MKLFDAPAEHVRPLGLRRNPTPRPLEPKARYDVTTWDGEKQEFTPQKGVRRGPYTLFGLRKALRKLKDMGYGTHRSDGVSILVERKG